ncbi:MAG: DMT family transporter [Hyphomicrobium sp.]
MSTTAEAAPEPGARLNGITLVSCSIMVWATGGLFTRLLPFDLWTIVFWRGVFAAVFIGCYAAYVHGMGIGGIIRKCGWAGVIVSLCSCATIILFPAAFQSTSVANAFTMVAALPFFTAGIAWVWLKERPSRPTLVASAVAALGLFIMVGPYSSGLHSGDVLALIGTLAQALMIVAARRHPNVVMLPMAWIAVVLSSVLAYPLAAQLWELTPRDYLVAAGFGLGPMTLGMMLYVIGSAMIPAALTALISIAEAPLGALWAWVGIGEVPSVATIIGGAIVLVSVGSSVMHQRRL